MIASIVQSNREENERTREKVFSFCKFEFFVISLSLSDFACVSSDLRRNFLLNGCSGFLEVVFDTFNCVRRFLSLSRTLKLSFWPFEKDMPLSISFRSCANFSGCYTLAILLVPGLPLPLPILIEKIEHIVHLGCVSEQHFRCNQQSPWNFSKIAYSTGACDME